MNYETLTFPSVEGFSFGRCTSTAGEWITSLVRSSFRDRKNVLLFRRHSAPHFGDPQHSQSKWQPGQPGSMQSQRSNPEAMWTPWASKRAGFLFTFLGCWTRVFSGSVRLPAWKSLTCETRRPGLSLVAMANRYESEEQKISRSLTKRTYLKEDSAQLTWLLNPFKSLIDSVQLFLTPSTEEIFAELVKSSSKILFKLILNQQASFLSADFRSFTKPKYYRWHPWTYVKSIRITLWTHQTFLKIEKIKCWYSRERKLA